MGLLVAIVVVSVPDTAASASAAAVSAGASAVALSNAELLTACGVYGTSASVPKEIFATLVQVASSMFFTIIILSSGNISTGKRLSKLVMYDCIFSVAAR